MTIQISISGPLLSGKTTLINLMKKNITSQIEVIYDIPRQAINLLGSTFCEKDITGFQNYIGFQQLIEENTQLRDGLKFRILDKSLIDCVAYWNILVKRETPVWAECLNSNRYTLVIICNHRDIKAYTNDSIRHPHMKYRNELASEIDRITKFYNFPVLHVSGSVEKRLETVLSELKRLSIINN